MFMFAIGVHFAQDTYNRFIGEKSDKAFVSSTSGAAKRGHAEHWEASQPAKVLRANPVVARMAWAASFILLVLGWSLAALGRRLGEPAVPENKGRPPLMAGLMGLVAGGLTGPVFKLMPMTLVVVPPIILLLWWRKRRRFLKMSPIR